MSSLIGFDLETTGVSVVNDRPVQACLVMAGEYGPRVLMNTYVNPRTPIPPNATAVHKITNAMVSGAPDFAIVAWSIKVLMEKIPDAVLVTFNGHSFDVPMINNCLGEQVFSCPHIDVLRFVRRYFPTLRGPTKADGKPGGQTLGELYNILFNKPLLGAHDASADVIATLEVLEGLRKRAAVSLEQLAAEQTKAMPWSIMPFGKYAGMVVTEVPKSWASFMKSKAEKDGTPLTGDLEATVEAILAA